MRLGSGQDFLKVVHDIGDKPRRFRHIFCIGYFIQGLNVSARFRYRLVLYETFKCRSYHLGVILKGEDSVAV